MNQPSHLRATQTAILLLNLGTPEAPTRQAVGRYLREFLSDPRVVEIPKLVWWFLLNLIILPIRSGTSAKKYASIWLGDLGSPLLHYSRLQAQALQAKFTHAEDSIVVELAMRYGQPSMNAVFEKMKALGTIERLLVLPLYPQYSATTSASSFDEILRLMSRWRNQPELRIVKNFHDNPAYISALSQSIIPFWQQNGRPNFAAGERLVMSFHGLPKRNLLLGDPYHCECLKTGRLLGEALDLEPGQYLVTFQSRFGKAEWLKPYTALTLEALGAKECPRVDIVCPGFPADCLETLEEIAMEGKILFEEAGGKNYNYIACLNDSPQWIDALMMIAKSHLGGWPMKPETATELHLREERATLAMSRFAGDN
ncbi:MAG: ferrochelatase [Burkholderiales bacterium]|nr:ferrochelatase [Burkholderiales bacterium]